MNFHDFVIKHFFQIALVLGIVLFCILKYINVNKVVNEEDVNEEEDEDDVNEDDVELTLSNRMDQIEFALIKQLEALDQLKRIEQLASLIETEKKKGIFLERLYVIEAKKLVYVFNILDFNNFCRSVYDEVKENSQCKQRSKIMKKVGKMWCSMSDEEKMCYKIE